MLSALVKRELMVALRARRTRLVALGYLLALIAVVFWMWPDQAVFSIAAQSTRSMVLVFVVTLIALVLTYAPAVSATAIVSERENNSYDLLYASRLRPWEIVVGKLLAVFFMLMIFVVLSFPVFASGFFLGAVSPEETTRIYLVCTITSLFFGLFGLWVSARAKSSYSALLRTYLLVLLVGVGPWIPYILLGKSQFWVPYVHALRALSPLSAVSSILIPGFDPALGVAVTPAWVLYLYFAGAGSLILLSVILWDAYAEKGPPVRKQTELIDDKNELFRRRLRFPFYLIDPNRRKKFLANWMNPVYARELRSRAFGGGIWIFRGAYICLAVSIILMVLMLGQFTGFSPEVIKATSVGFQIGLILMLVPPLTAGGVTRERELRMMDDIRLSRIGPWQLLSGKLLVAMVFVSFLVVGSVPLWIVIVYMQMNSTEELLIVVAILVSTVVLALTTGLLSSAWLQRTAAADAAAYGLLFALVIATLLPWLQPEKFAEAFRFKLLGLNPFVSAVQVVNPDPLSLTPVLWRSHLIVSICLSVLFMIVASWRVHYILKPEK